MLGKILGDPNERAVKKMRPIVDAIGGFEDGLKKLSDEQLKQKTEEFRGQLKEGKQLDDILPEAFACVREAAKRTLKQRHYDAQLIGGIVLHQGRIAEMKTGEGKTLASTSPTYLNAIEGEGVHVVTVNDYLAKRDAVWMGQIYSALGLSVGVITHEGAFLYDETHIKKDEDNYDKLDEERDEMGNFMVKDEFLRPVERKEAYGADITYGTNNEFGFDYLRDNLAQSPEGKAQRGHNFAIVDEIDSILIDESRTPLIISAPDTESTKLYATFARIVPTLKEDKDYNVDYKLKAVSITEDGIDKVEKALNVKNIYDTSEGGGIRYVHNLEQSLKAHVLFTRDKDYVVKEGEVIIVDEFTGRLMPGRRYSEGLHQAIEAKEGVEVQRESRTLASITFQNYFRMYDKLAGMTGTAVTSAEEFDRVYKLDIVVVPTNKPMVRSSYPDLIFRTQKGKMDALVRDIKERHEKGQPVLIGTTSIEKNEVLDLFLQKEGIKHETLNAKNHEREGAIIAQAGRLGAVTVATNMAGRGVDIILGGDPPDKAEAKKVRELGGLHVVGTERHEARRIDDQLRGRAGRQGDPGSSQFFLSLEDDIMRVFGGDRVKQMMHTLKLPEDQPIESKMVSNAIEGAQKRIEGMNFDTRKKLLDYDEVLSKHRENIYKRRNKILEADDDEIKEIAKEHLENYFSNLLNFHLAGDYAQDWNIEEVYEETRAIVGVEDDFHKELQEVARQKENINVLREKATELVFGAIDKAYSQREKEIGAEQMRQAERWLMLRTIDLLWMEHLDAMNHMRDSVRLRAYAQRDPLVEYKNEGMQMFTTLKDTIEADVVKSLLKVHVHVHGDSLSKKVAENITLGRPAPPKAEGQHSHDHSHGHSHSPSPQAENKQSTPAGADKIGRNDPCHCGSGKKYKKCHGA